MTFFGSWHSVGKPYYENKLIITQTFTVMTYTSPIQENLLVDQANVSIPYSEETIVLNQVMRRHDRPFSAIKQSKFRKMFNRHRCVSGYH